MCQSGLSSFLFFFCASKLATFLLSISPSATLWFSRASPILSPTASFASGIFIAWGMGWNLCTKLCWVNEFNPFSAMLSLCFSERNPRAHATQAKCHLGQFGGVWSAGALKCARLEFSGCCVKPRRTRSHFDDGFWWVIAILTITNNDDLSFQGQSFLLMNDLEWLGCTIIFTSIQHNLVLLHPFQM